MAQGTFTPNLVMAATLNVYVNDVLREHVKADWGIDTSGGLPDSIVNAGTGMRSRTGKINWKPGTAVIAAPYMPVGESRWAPQEGDKVFIEAEVGGQKYARFTGRLGKTEYSFVDDTVVSQITDGLGDALQEIMSVEPAVTYGAGYVRSGAIAYRALEQAGLGAVPRVAKDTFAHATLQSGTLAVVGTMIEGGTGVGDPAGFNTRDGVKIGQAEVVRSGRSALVLGRGSTQADSRITVDFTDGTKMVLHYYQASRQLALYKGGVSGSIWYGAYTGDENPPIMALQVKLDGTVRVWTGRETYVDTTATAPTGANVSVIGGDGLSGITGQYSWTDTYPPQIVSSTAQYMPLLKFSNLEQNYLSAIRGYENVTARSIIDEWGDATLGALWLDEYGRANLVARDRLVTSYSTGTDKVAEKVFTGSWEKGRDSLRSGVIVEGKENVIKGTFNGVTAVVYQPSNNTEIKYGEPLEEFYKTPDDEDWINVHLAWKPIIDMGHGIDNRDLFASSTDGSWWQISFENPTDREKINWTGAGYENLSAKLEKLGQRTLKATYSVDGNKYPSVERYLLASPTGGVDGIPASRRGIPMPIIRAKWLVQWADFTREGSSRGPEWAPSMKLTSDWFLDVDDAQRVADALSTEVTQDTVTFGGLEMLWNPSVQVGDTRKLIGYGFDGVDYFDAWEAEYLVTGYDESWDGNVPTWSVSAQCKKLTSLKAGKTYYDLATAYTLYSDIEATGATYAGVYDALPGKA